MHEFTVILSGACWQEKIPHFIDGARKSKSESSNEEAVEERSVQDEHEGADNNGSESPRGDCTIRSNKPPNQIKNEEQETHPP